MKIIKIDVLKKIEKELYEFGRPVERALFDVLINNGSCDRYLEELIKFQLDDGGFGLAIEPDFRIPNSSPMATSVGIRSALRFKEHPVSKSIVAKAIGYLVETYDEARIGWYSVGKEVNNFPHSPWWHWNAEEKMTAIDKYWGNPSAELLGYLIKNKEYTASLDLEIIKRKAISNIESIEEFESFHELYCYGHLLETVEEFGSTLLSKVTEGINAMVEKDTDNFYRGYSPVPLDFINNRRYTYEMPIDLIESNIDILVDRLESEILLTPHWDLNEELYTGEMKTARNEILLVNCNIMNYIILGNFQIHVMM
jgi:hypothetical protein